MADPAVADLGEAVRAEAATGGEGDKFLMSKKPVKQTEGAQLKKLKELYEFMTQHELDSLELDDEGSHVRLVRRSSAPALMPVLTQGAAALPAGAAVPAPAAGADALPTGTVMIKAAMMGIFYRSPTPSSPPYVKEGDVVKPGQVLCMVEAMKVFNEIKADFGGTIIKALVENGKPVKSGQDLFAVQRA